jgi:hypothetical protein
MQDRHAPIPTSGRFHYPIPDSDYPMPSQHKPWRAFVLPIMSNSYDLDPGTPTLMPCYGPCRAARSITFAAAAMDHLSRSVLSFRRDITMRADVVLRARRWAIYVFINDCGECRSGLLSRSNVSIDICCNGCLSGWWKCDEKERFQFLLYTIRSINLVDSLLL